MWLWGSHWECGIPLWLWGSHWGCGGPIVGPIMALWIPLWLCGFHCGSVVPLCSVFPQCVWGLAVYLGPGCAVCSHSGFGVPRCVWGPIVPCVPIVDLGSRGVFGARLCRVAGAAPIAVSP